MKESKQKIFTKTGKVKCQKKINLKKKKKNMNTLQLPISGTFFKPKIIDNYHSSDEDEENLSSKRETKAQKVKKEIDALKEIQEMERRQTDSSYFPTTVEEFEKLIAQSPYSSVNYLMLMTHFITIGETAKAESVAKEALETIPLNKENDRNNIWRALLRIEVHYGTKSCKELINEASNKLEILQIIAESFYEIKKYEDSNNVIDRIISSHKGDPKSYIYAALFYIERDRMKAAKAVMKKAIESLHRTDHISFILKYAIALFKAGNHSEGHELLRNFLENYPKRLDIWLVLIDQLIAAKQIIDARKTLNKLAAMKWKANKIKTILFKFKNFEKKYGDHQSLEEVKILIENRKNGVEVKEI